MVNSPYGGLAWSNGTVAPGSLSTDPSLGNEYEIGVENGRASWAGFGAGFNVSNESNQREGGPGSNVRCTTPFAISVTYSGGIILVAPLLGQGNLSEARESDTLNLTLSPSHLELYILNEFTSANAPNVSTCGGLATSRWANSAGFATVVPVVIDRAITNVPYIFPFAGSFHYWFPPNFGTWQIDNLSAPGGPGGG